MIAANSTIANTTTVRHATVKSLLEAMSHLGWAVKATETNAERTQRATDVRLALDPTSSDAVIDDLVARYL